MSLPILLRSLDTKFSAHLLKTVFRQVLWKNHRNCASLTSLHVNLFVNMTAETRICTHDYTSAQEQCAQYLRLLIKIPHRQLFPFPSTKPIIGTSVVNR